MKQYTKFDTVKAQNCTDREIKCSVICEEMDSGLTITRQEGGLPGIVHNCVKISPHFSAVVAEEKRRRNKVKEDQLHPGT